jgi:hypothetical protein
MTGMATCMAGLAEAAATTGFSVGACFIHHMIPVANITAATNPK